LHLLHFARQKGISLDITIFEPRDHSALGPRGCKGCAGILSTRMLNGLATLELSVSREVIQSELHSYSVHVDGDNIKIDQPDSLGIRSIPWWRSHLHQCTTGKHDISPYSSMRAWCTTIQSSVTKVTNEKLPVVSTSRESYPADLIVLATGVSSNNPLASSFRYRGPVTEMMVQDEVLRPDSWPADEVNVYLKQPAGMIFCVLTPKGRCLNVSCWVMG
jgi:hypothetical protein